LQVVSEVRIPFTELSFGNVVNEVEKLIPEEVSIADAVSDQEVGRLLESSNWLHCF